ncbi:MAG TPA: LPS export ABC transporter permease LptG [Burkholderiaceae bacterium]|nr:LPS export ABC transporter permease LptG [Burkholderiaceae bacterium]
MTRVGRYVAREVLLGIGLVLLAFLSLFAFFDFVNELDDIGRGGYRVQHAMLYVLLTVPNRIYELMPIAALIGAIYALAQFASTSEFTAMRAAGMGRMLALSEIVKVGALIAVATALVGEGLAPPADRLAQRVRLGALDATITGQFRSGLWIKDTLRDATGQPQRLRFVNVGMLLPDTTLQNLRIFEFDPQFRLVSVLRADRGAFAPPNLWQLSGVEETRFISGRGVEGLPTLAAQVERHPQRLWESDLSPEIVAVLTLQPDRMSVFTLAQYVRHLRENRQSAERYEIALWRKIVYPLAAVVMVVLALPFGFLQARAGGIGYKVFAGIMLGVGFHFLNGLFSHLGLLNTWPPWIAASAPSAVALAMALGMLAWVGRTR